MSGSLLAELRCSGMPNCGVHVGLFWTPTQVPLPDFVQARFAVCTDFALDLRSLAACTGVELPSLWRVLLMRCGSAHVVAVLTNLKNDFADFLAAQLVLSSPAQEPAADNEISVGTYQHVSQEQRDRQRGDRV